MSNKARHIKILGLSLLVALGLVAVGAPGAQAQEFRVGGETFTEAGVQTEEADAALPLWEFSIFNGLKIHCELSLTFPILVTRIFPPKVSFKSIVSIKCKILNNKFCTIYPTEEDLEEETDAGLIQIAAVGVLRLHAGTHYLEAESEEFTRVYMGGPLCTLPEENLMHGSMAFSLPTALEELVSQSISPVSLATEELLGVALFYGEERATIEGGAGTMWLSGVNEGETWGAE